jgi:hypothetical protein
MALHCYPVRYPKGKSGYSTLTKLLYTLVQLGGNEAGGMPCVLALTPLTIVGSDKSVGESFWISSPLGAGVKCGNG